MSTAGGVCIYDELLAIFALLCALLDSQSGSAPEENGHRVLVPMCREKNRKEQSHVRSGRRHSARAQSDLKGECGVKLHTVSIWS